MSSDKQNDKKRAEAGKVCAKYPIKLDLMVAYDGSPLNYEALHCNGSVLWLSSKLWSTALETRYIYTSKGASDLNLCIPPEILRTSTPHVLWKN